jgi:hypothetical protein
MPLTAISDRAVLDEIVGRVDGDADLGGGVFEVRIGLAVLTTGLEAGSFSICCSATPRSIPMSCPRMGYFPMR